MTSLRGHAYPRVLLVLMTKVKAADSSNLLIRTEFGVWPKEALAQVHATADPPGQGEMCGYYYQLGACDRSLGTFFQRLRAHLFPMISTDEVIGIKGAESKRSIGHLWRAIKKHIGDWVVNTGFWEVVFRICLSKPMADFIDGFKPDLVYCQGYSLGFARLPLLISQKVKIPICFQTTDDWPSRLYRWSPVGWLLRRRARELILSAKVRLAFGEKMRQEFQRRYSVPFEVSYHLDDSNRFKVGGSPVENVYKIVYTGSLGHRRYEAIGDLLKAVRRISGLASRIEIIVHCSGIPKDMPLKIRQAPEVSFLPLPEHSQLPEILAGAKVLFLPESFNEPRRAIEYSISSKAHFYMMSGRPILVYGPVYSGTIGYALREGWGLVIAKRSTETIIEILREILAGSERVTETVRNADRCIRQYHDLEKGRERFLQLLIGAMSEDNCSSVNPSFPTNDLI